MTAISINQLENHLNAHSGISIVKMKTMAAKITTKELIYRINQMRHVIVEQAYKSLESNLYYKINHGLYSLLQKTQILKIGSVYTQKIIESDSFSILGIQTLANYLFIYCEDLVH